MTAKKFDKPAQLPQAILPGTYTMKEGPAGYGQSAVPRGKAPGVFITPGDTSEESTAIRAHEMGHLGLQAGKFLTYSTLGDHAAEAGITDEVLNICTDMLVNGKFKDIIGDLPIRADMETLDVMSPEDLILHTARAMSLPRETDDSKNITMLAREKLGDETVNYINQITRCIKSLGANPKLRYSPFIKLAQQLDDLVKQAGIGPGAESVETGIPNPKPKHIPADEWWGDMGTDELDLKRDVMRMLGARKWKLGYVGAMRAPTRWFSDYKMYGIKRKRVPSNVLIDTSGSMCLSDEQIMEILKNSPYATVAMYSGNGRKGMLTVIARQGFVATIEDIHHQIKRVGGGNIVDGMALRWLAEQKGNRYWISDGGVTGCGEHCSEAMNADCDMLKHIHGIEQYYGVEQYVAGDAADGLRGW